MESGFEAAYNRAIDNRDDALEPRRPKKQPVQPDVKLARDVLKKMGKDLKKWVGQ